jgi:predicted alpha-1,6-mannanase (GH76 family)
MKIHNLLHHLRGTWCVLTTASLLLGGFQTASAFTQAEQSLAYDSWTNTFLYYNSGAHGLVFRNQEQGNGNTSFWQGAEMIEVVEDAVQAGLDSPNTVISLCTSYTNNNSDVWSWNTYNDDIMWACRAFNRAYQLTGNRTWLLIAQNNWNIAFNRGWCFSCGGGLYQDTGSGASFCTCGNAPGADAAFMLYTNLNGITSTNTYFLGRAQLMYNWMVANVWNSSNGGVEEGPGNPGVYFTYDDGTFSEVALWLGDIAKVQAVGNFVQSKWGTSWQSFGTGSDAGIFNTIGIRGLALTGYNTAFLQASAERGWGYRNNLNLGSVNFGGQTPNGTDLYAADASDLPEALVCAPVQMANGTYNIVDRNSGLDMTDPSTSNGQLLDQSANTGSTSQQWTVTYLGNGIYEILGVQSGLSLDVVGSGTANGTGIDAYTYNSSYANQQWSLTPTSGGYCRLTPQNALASCVDVQNSATTNGAPLVLWSCNLTNSPNSQQWAFVSPGVANGIYNLVNLNSGLAADVQHATTTNGSPVNQYTINGGANQQWGVTNVGGGIYEIIGVPSGRALSTDGGGSANGTEMDIYDYSGASYQQWSFTPTSGGYYRLTPQNATGSCLDVQHSGTTNDTPLEIWTYGGGNSQQWSLQTP